MSPFVKLITILSGNPAPTPTPPDPPVGAEDDFLLLETEEYFLLETGDKLILDVAA